MSVKLLGAFGVCWKLCSCPRTQRPRGGEEEGGRDAQGLRGDLLQAAEGLHLQRRLRPTRAPVRRARVLANFSDWSFCLLFCLLRTTLHLTQSLWKWTDPR